MQVVGSKLPTRLKVSRVFTEASRVTSTIVPRSRRDTEPGGAPGPVMTDGADLTWNQVFDELGPALTSFARSRGVRDPEDLVQEVFAAAIDPHHPFAGDRSGLRAYLFTIAYRRVADEHRRRYRRPEILVSEHPSTPDLAPEVEEVVSRRDLVNKAVNAFSVLSDRERLVLQMRIFDEATPAQVGAILGISTGNVRVIQARALTKVRRFLTSTPDGGVAPTLVLVGPLEVLRYLRDRLRTGDLLGEWVAEVRSTAKPTTPGVVSASPQIQVGAIAPPAGEHTTHSVTSLVSAVADIGIARIGALVSVVAIAAGTAVPAITTDPVPPREATVSTITEHYVDMPRPSERTVRTESFIDGSISAALDESSPVAPEAPKPDDGPVPSIDVVVAPTTVGTVELVEGVVDPLFGDIVEPIVEDVVEPLVEEVLSLVTDDIVEPIVEETVVPLVDEAGDTVGDLIGGVGDTLDDTVEGLGDLLGGLG